MAARHKEILIMKGKRLHNRIRGGEEDREALRAPPVVIEIESPSPLLVSFMRFGMVVLGLKPPGNCMVLAHPQVSVGLIFHFHGPHYVPDETDAIGKGSALISRIKFPGGLGLPCQ